MDDERSHAPQSAGLRDALQALDNGGLPELVKSASPQFDLNSAGHTHWILDTQRTSQTPFELKHHARVLRRVRQQVSSHCKSLHHPALAMSGALVALFSA